jgi:hypothetical protein
MAGNRKDELLKLMKPELAQIAKELNLSSYSDMSKNELADLIVEGEKKAQALERKARTATAKPEPTKSKAETPKSVKASKSTSAEPPKPKSVSRKPAKEASFPTSPEKPMATKTRASRKATAKTEGNGVAIQHPSASPTALRYGRFMVDEGEAAEISTHEPVVWPDRNSIPEKYGRDRLVTLIRDPRHLFCFWEISDDKIAELSQIVPEDLWLGRRMALRVFRETGGMPRHISTIDIYGEIGRYHIEVPEPGARYFVEIGFFFADGRYETVLTDRFVKTPQVRPPRVGPIRWLYVKTRTAHRVTSLETHTVPHPAGAARTIRKAVNGVVDERRREFAIDDDPSPTSPNRKGTHEGADVSSWLHADFKSGVN